MAAKDTKVAVEPEKLDLRSHDIKTERWAVSSSATDAQ